MRYYDNIFRQSMLDMLSNYRKLLSQLELDDKNNNIFISESIKKIDQACKIIKPSAFDFLTEKRIKKLQESEYYKQVKESTEAELREKIQAEVEKNLKEKLKNEVRSELEPQIKEEFKQERAKRKAQKKAKKQSDDFEKIKTEFIEKINAALGQQIVTQEVTENANPQSSKIEEQEIQNERSTVDELEENSYDEPVPPLE